MRMRPSQSTVMNRNVGSTVWFRTSYDSLYCSAIRGQYAPLDGDEQANAKTEARAGWRQGFVSNITNPKVLVFYLAVLPQFLAPGAGLGWLLMLAWTQAVIGVAYLLVLIAGLHSARRLLARRKVRRGMDATTGAVLLGFSAKLATEHI